MAKTVLRGESIKLRLQGYTFGQIKRELGVAKSTLSGWVRKLPLSEEQILLLSKNRLISRDIRIEKFRQTARNKWIARLKTKLSEQEKVLLPLTEKELFIAGVFLYWGEGSKQRGTVAISNTDPRVIKFALHWLTKVLGVQKEKVYVRLHLYKDMDRNAEESFWSDTLNIPKCQFKASYVKKTNREGITYKSFGHGTCNLLCFSVDLSEKIAMSIKAISEFYGAKSDKFWYN